jgi:hypothetical protein
MIGNTGKKRAAFRENKIVCDVSLEVDTSVRCQIKESTSNDHLSTMNYSYEF